jgi:hypothetical protein
VRKRAVTEDSLNRYLAENRPRLPRASIRPSMPPLTPEREEALKGYWGRLSKVMERHRVGKTKLTGAYKKARKEQIAAAVVAKERSEALYRLKRKTPLPLYWPPGG